MRFKESLALDRMINKRRESLARHEGLELEKRAQALAVLIEARKQLDEIGDREPQEYVRYHKRFVGTDENGRKIRSRRRRESRRQHNVDDLQRNYCQRHNNPSVTVEVMARFLRNEIRRNPLVWLDK